MNRRKTVGVVILLLCIQSILAKDYNEYHFVNVYQFENGRDEGQIGGMPDNVGSYVGPSGPSMVFSGGILIIADALNRRIMEFNSSFQLSRNIPVNSELSFGQIKKVNKYFISYNVSERLTIFNDEGGVLSDFWEKDSQNVLFRNSRSKISTFLLLNDTIILQENHTPGFFVLENITKNRTTKRLDSFTIERFQDILHEKLVREKLDSSVILDAKGRLISDNDISTLDYKVFLEYWKEKQQANNYKKPETKINFDPERFTKGFNLFYLGKDYEGNYYWSIESGSVLVFNPDGFLIENFIVDSRKSKVIPAVHPTGDVYFLGWDDKQVYLYYVHKVW